MKDKLKSWWERYLTIQTDDAHLRQRGRVFLIVLLLVIVANVASVVQVFIASIALERTVVVVVGLFLFAGLAEFTRRGHAWTPYVFLFVLALLIMSLNLAPNSIMALAYALPIVLAPLISESWMAIPMAVVTTVVVYIMHDSVGDSMQLGLLPVILFGIFGGAAWFASKNLERALRDTERNAGALQATNQDLQTERVLLAQRTTELEHRARDLQATADISREVLAELSQHELLDRVVRLVSQRFEVYHVGVFLLDDMREWAVLQAASSLVGQQLLAHAYQVRVGTAETVGAVVQQGTARIWAWVSAIKARDVLQMPDTRSVITLPLQTQGETIGVLDVHSTEANAFVPDDITALQSLADQVTLAINNARLFAQLESSIETQRRLYGDLSHDAWRELLQARSDLAYRSTERGVRKLPLAAHAFLPGTPAAQAFTLGEMTVGEALPDGRVPVAVPVRSANDDIIGVIDTYKLPTSGAWSADELALLREVADRLGSALESAQFYYNIQQQAAREQLTRELTDEMRASIDMEAILRTAVESLGRAIGAPRTYVRLLPPRAVADDVAVTDEAQIMRGDE